MINFFKKNQGFSLLEVLVSVAIFSFLLLAVVSSVFWMNYSSSKAKADREALENGRKVLDSITYEIRGAKSVYTSTTNSSQLSLETTRYLPNDETTTFIDFFLCGSAICLKKESQDPVVLTSDTVQVSSVTFSQVSNGNKPSIKIDLTLSASNETGSSSVNLLSTASLRSY